MSACESELEWLLYALWTKKSPLPTQFSFGLPDTVVLRDGKPHTWYFTSKDGSILKKNYQNVTAEKVGKAFKSESDAFDCQAQSYTYLPALNCCHLLFDYVHDTKAFLASQTNSVNLLQKFVLP